MAPDHPDAPRVQAALESFADRVEHDPHGVLADMAQFRAELTNWSDPTAYVWCCHIEAQALRFTDQIDASLTAARSGLARADADSAVVPHLNLEIGTTCNQAGRHHEALAALADSADGFEHLGDAAGLAWTSVAQADALCGLSRADEALAFAELAERLSAAVHDTRIQMRAIKQLAVIERQRGNPALALGHIQRVLDAPLHPHARANALLEYGHIVAQAGNPRAADDAYVAASVEYAAYGDTLGLANVERALATNDLLLDRRPSAAHHLDRAVHLYEDLGNDSGLGLVLTHRGLLALAAGDDTAAAADCDRAITVLRAVGDRLGVISALRAAARIAINRGDRAHADTLTAQALTEARDVNSPLAEAGALLMRGEIADDPQLRLTAAADAARIYDRLRVWIGSAYARTFAAAAAADLGHTYDALTLASRAAQDLRSSRGGIADSGRRADFDFSSRDVTAGLYRVYEQLGERTAARQAADLIINELPLGLRTTMTEGLNIEATEVLDRIRRVRASSKDSGAPTHLLHQLGVALTSDTAAAGAEPATFTTLRQADRGSAMLAVGAPTSSRELPIAWAAGDDLEVHFTLTPIDQDAIDMIETLAAVDAQTASHDVLIGDAAAAWQQTLATVMLPEGLITHLLSRDQPRELTVLLNPVLAHLPIEALLLSPGHQSALSDGHGPAHEASPLGLVAAVRRLPVPTPPTASPHLAAVTAYLDPAIRFTPERDSLTGFHLTGTAEEFRASIGADQLILAACHGANGVALSARLRTTSAEHVLDAADLLDHPLNGSVVILEACWAGRYTGHRSGEQLTMATAALLAGAAACVAPLFALPADDTCTGIIVAALLRHAMNGIAPAEALRRARVEYLSEDQPVQVPASADVPARLMARTSPWAWAGLTVYG